MAAPGGEAMQRSPGTPNGDVIEHSDDEKDRQEYLEVNFKYPLLLMYNNFPATLCNLYMLI